jgi:CRISPR/Cas system-associated protein Csx1
MTVPFSQMPSNAKVWIYASDKLIDASQLETINKMATPFIQSWTAHQNQLKAEFAVLYHCFLVFMVDESYNEISGCGIDKSVNLVKDIAEATKLNLFNRLKIQIYENQLITIFSKAEIIDRIENNNLASDVKTFNNQINNKLQFDSEWIIDLKTAWFYPKTKLQSV